MEDLPIGLAHVESVSVDEALVRLCVVEHLVEEEHALLDPVQLLLDLLLVVWPLLGLGTGHDLHQLLRGGQVLWRSPADELLQLGSLRGAVLLLQLLGRLEALESRMPG